MGLKLEYRNKTKELYLVRKKLEIKSIISGFDLDKSILCENKKTCLLMSDTLDLVEQVISVGRHKIKINYFYFLESEHKALLNYENAV